MTSSSMTSPCRVSRSRLLECGRAAHHRQPVPANGSGSVTSPVTMWNITNGVVFWNYFGAKATITGNAAIYYNGLDVILSLEFRPVGQDETSSRAISGLELRSTT